MPVSQQGVTDDRYMLIPRTLIFLTRGDSLLLVKGAPHKRLWANQYNGLGGHIERREELFTAARREIIEETGLTPDNLWLAGTVFIDTHQNPGIVLFVLRGECTIGNLHPSLEGIAEWVAPADMFKLPLVEDLRTLLPRVLDMQPGDPPFSAFYSYDSEDKLVIRFGS
jgi:8-oxo-dGTP diphosphatase